MLCTYGRIFIDPILNKEININEAREKNLVMENSVDVKMKELMCTLTLSKDDSCK